MLFNSYEFIFLFLPLGWAVFYWLAGRGWRQAALGWLVAASLGFYAWWNPVYLPLLGVLIVFNYVVGVALSRHAGTRPGRWLLAFGIAVDLGVLAYYKYANFFVDNLDALTGAGLRLEHIVLPLAISFFTFQKIAYLVDAYRGEAREYRFLHFCLFVTFFPQLIAGPIVHHRDIIPQFARDAVYRISRLDLAVGITLFTIGLFKKAVLADGIAVYANPVFAAAAAGAQPTLFESWGGVLAYTFQLYFDFSGYSDMAIGAARIFGIRLPLNFNSPYRATSIVDFWRRWHMTLSRFLRDYLYIALGGNRHGPLRRHLNLIATMLLGGLWHGAGWNFVVWGGLHGAYLTINHAWSQRRGKRPASRGGRLAGWALTFFAVVLAWVFFRATSLDAALRLLAGMAGLNGVSLPEAIALRLPGLAAPLQALGVAFTPGGGGQFVATWAWIAALAPIAWLAPNSQQWLRAYRPALGARPAAPAPGWRWRPTPRWALAVGALSGIGVLTLSHVTEFLYFQF